MNGSRARAPGDEVVVFSIFLSLRSREAADNVSGRRATSAHFDYHGSFLASAAIEASSPGARPGGPGAEGDCFRLSVLIIPRVHYAFT